MESSEWVPINRPDNEIDRAKVRSPDELRDDLLKHIQALKAELQRIQPLYGRLGHNNPPEDLRLVPLSQADRGQVLESLDRLEEQAKSHTPSEAQVHESTSILRTAASKAWVITKRKVDKATDKIAESVALLLLASGEAPTAYHWIQDAASSLYAKLLNVTYAADLWLSSINIHLPF